MSDINSVEVVVIGAGPGGYSAAFLAADLGMDVTIVDPEANPGGVCLYRGCIPSKTLLHVAKLIHEAENAYKWGISFAKPEINLDQLRSWKESVVEKLTSGLGLLRNQRKIKHIQGRAVFIDNKTLEITADDGSKSRLLFNNAVLATGSFPTRIPSLSIDSPRVMDSSGALALEDIPETLLIIGGGYIGLEMGTAYAALGSKVTVVEMMPNLLPGADKDLVRVLQKELTASFDNILLNAKVMRMQEVEGGVSVTIETKAGEQEQYEFSKVLVSVGRTPNTKGLGLENTKITLDERGFIVVDQQRRTAEPNIFAIGDIAGEPMLAHKAAHEGRTAIEAIAGRKVAFEPHAIPAIVFTDPEIAWCGLTEAQAKERGQKVNVMRFPWAASGRALTQDRPDGLTKLIFDPETERLLGMGIAGAGAGELIAEGVLAIEMAALAKDISLSIHPHPTLSETVMETADMLFGQSTHVYRPKRKK